MRYQYLKKNGLGVCCRTCLNQMYHMRLQSKDCNYIAYKYTCGKCGEMQNIVADIRKMSRYKVFFAKK